MENRPYLSRNWTCVTCGGKRLNFRGVPRHRAMHRDRQERVVMDVRRGSRIYTETYDYRPGKNTEE